MAHNDFMRHLEHAGYYLALVANVFYCSGARRIIVSCKHQHEKDFRLLFTP